MSISNQVNQYLGTSSSSDHIMPNYAEWGLIQNPNKQKFLPAEQIMRVPYDQAYDYIEKISLPVDLTDFNLVSAYWAPYYQGENHSDQKIAWFRWQPKYQKLASLGGEHISIILDVTEGKLLGLTRMLANLNDSSCVTHQQALITALNFLEKNAPDLKIGEAEIPKLTSLPLGSRIEFAKNDPRASFGKAQLLWIDAHKETGVIKKAKFETFGMKVKMYLPEQQLFLWIIVDKNNEVQTFERNINWNFDKFQRNTQMWLHDQWLICQDVKL